jgi:ankyrin repeat protein
MLTDSACRRYITQPARLRETKMMELLLHTGADTKVRTKDGLTALALAKKYGNTELQSVLEQAGAVE